MEEVDCRSGFYTRDKLLIFSVFIPGSGPSASTDDRWPRPVCRSFSVCVYVSVCFDVGHRVLSCLSRQCVCVFIFLFLLPHYGGKKCKKQKQQNSKRHRSADSRRCIHFVFYYLISSSACMNSQTEHSIGGGSFLLTDAVFAAVNRIFILVLGPRVLVRVGFPKRLRSVIKKCDHDDISRVECVQPVSTKQGRRRRREENTYNCPGLCPPLATVRRRAALDGVGLRVFILVSCAIPSCRSEGKRTAL